MTAPQMARPAPTMAAARTRGRRSSQTIPSRSSETGLSGKRPRRWAMVAHTSPAPISAGPMVTASVIEATSRRTRPASQAWNLSRRRAAGVSAERPSGAATIRTPFAAYAHRSRGRPDQALVLAAAAALDPGNKSRNDAIGKYRGTERSWQIQPGQLVGEVQRGGDGTDAGFGGGERDRQVAGVPDGAQIGGGGVFIEQAYFLVDRIPLGVNEDQHVGIGVDHGFPACRGPGV